MVLPLKVKLLCIRVRKDMYKGSLSRVDLILFKLLCSALSFFRACSPSYGEVKVRTITGSFTGTSMVLPVPEVKQALRSMGAGFGGTMFRSKPTIFQWTTKSGPNAYLSILGIGLDLTGWILQPKKYMEYCKMC